MAIERPLILTPNDLRAEITLVENIVSALIKVVNRNVNLDEDVRFNFLKFVDEWNSYKNGLSGVKDSSGWSVADYAKYMVKFGASPALATLDVLPDGLKLMVTASWDKLQEFRDSANRWRQQLISEGVRVVDVDRTREIPQVQPTRAGFLPGLPWWMWLIGGGFLLWKISPLKTAERVKALRKPSKTVMIRR